jgi:hypothetical protein
MKKISITLLLLLSVAFIASGWLRLSKPGKRLASVYGLNREAHYSIPSPTSIKLPSQSLEAKAFIRKNRFNSAFCFLVDMRLPSYQKRFFVYDLNKDSIINSGLVTHGRCNEYWLEGRKYGNAP